MDRLLEIVLDIAASAPRTDGIAARLAAALPSLVASPQSGTFKTTLFDCAGALTAAGWRVATTRGGRDAAGVEVWRCAALTPGVHAWTRVFESTTTRARDLAPALFDDAPAEFRGALKGAESLQPAATFHHESRRWLWPRADSAEVELVLDENVRLSSSAEPLLHELRLRIRWPDGAAVQPALDTLFACAHALTDAVPAFIRAADVFERALAGDPRGTRAPMRAEPVDLRAARTAQEALIAIVRNLSAHWLGNDAGLRDSADPEFVHQMRVALRRLRTALRIFRAWRDDAWTTRIAPELKWIGEQLATARDLDVLADTTLPALVAADPEGSREWAPLCAEVERQRIAARERVRGAVASPRYAHAVLGWLEWVAALVQREQRGDDGGESLQRFARKRVRRYYRHIASAQKLSALDDAQRHGVRIDAKRLRYTLEFFEQAEKRSTRTKATRALSRLQGVLGDGNDAAIALRLLEQMSPPPYQLGFARGWCEATKRYTAQAGERLLRALPAPKIPRGRS